MTVKSILKKISKAAQDRDRESISSLLKDLSVKSDDSDDWDEDGVVDNLKKLRSNRWFGEISTIAKLARKSGVNSPAVRRHFAQGLIEDKHFDKAISVLDAVIEDTSSNDKEHSQAIGLKARTFKQIYVDTWDGDTDPVHESAIRNAAKLYRKGFELDLDFGQRIWHGINLAAVLSKSEADGVAVKEMGEWRKIARGLLKEVTERSSASEGMLNSWEYATAGEAAFALGDNKKAEHWFDLYKNSNPDEFQLTGTVRQLRELWGKRFDDPETGGMLLRLQALAAENENDSIEFGGEELLIAQSLASDKTQLFPQGRLNAAEYQSIQWFVNGLERAKAVVRIGRNEDEGSGTGFVVGKDELLGDAAGKPEFSEWPEFVLLTNAHVTTKDVETRLNPPDGPGGRPLYHSMDPAKAKASFQSERSLHRKWPDQHNVRQLYTSPFSNLDLTILKIEGWSAPDGFKPCPISTDPPTKRNKRILVIGHPLGQGLKFSTEGSDYLGHSHDPELPDPSQKVEIRYSSPTEGGSSGSPVFEETDWSVVGVHQGMVTNIKSKAHNKPISANQAVWIESIRHALQH